MGMCCRHRYLDLIFQGAGLGFHLLVKSGFFPGIFPPHVSAFAFPLSMGFFWEGAGLPVPFPALFLLLHYPLAVQWFWEQGHVGILNPSALHKRLPSNSSQYSINIPLNTGTAALLSLFFIPHEGFINGGAATLQAWERSSKSFHWEDGS